MAFGFKRINDTSALSLKDLNDQLELLWKKVMGGIEAKDMREGEPEAIFSENMSKQGASNLIRNGRGDYRLLGWEADGSAKRTYLEEDGVNTIEVISGNLKQFNIMVEASKKYTFRFLVKASEVPPESGEPEANIRLYAQNVGSGYNARDRTVYSGDIALSSGWVSRSIVFCAGQNEKSVSLEISGNGGFYLTGAQIIRGIAPQNYLPAEKEYYSGGLLAYDGRVEICSAEAEIKIPDRDLPDPENPKVAITSDAGGFADIMAQKIRGQGMTLAEFSPDDVCIYVSSNTGCDADEGTEASPVKSIAEAIRRIPSVCPGRVYIYLKTGEQWVEDIKICNKAACVYIYKYGPGDKPAVTGEVNIECVPRLIINQIAFIHSGDASSEQWANISCSNVYLTGCVITRGASVPSTAKAVRTEWCQIYIYGGSITGFAYALGLYYMSAGLMRTNTGVCNRIAYVYGSILLGDNTWPDYVAGKCTKTCGGQVLCEGTCSTGSMPSPLSVPAVKQYECTASGSWKDGKLYAENGDRVYQGELEDTVKSIGMMVFPNGTIISDIGTKSVKSAHIFLSRGTTLNNMRKLHLYGSSKSQVSGDMPGLAKDYGYIGALGGVESAWIGIPVSAVNDIKSGAVKSLLLYDESRNYMWIYGHATGGGAKCPKLRIAYQ